MAADGLLDQCGEIRPSFKIAAPRIAHIKLDRPRSIEFMEVAGQTIGAVCLVCRNGLPKQDMVELREILSRGSSDHAVGDLRPSP